jgi:hypothetical protein
MSFDIMDDINIMPNDSLSQLSAMASGQEIDESTGAPGSKVFRLFAMLNNEVYYSDSIKSIDGRDGPLYIHVTIILISKHVSESITHTSPIVQHASGSRTHWHEHTRARRENVRERAEQEVLEALRAEQAAKLAREAGILARLAARRSGAISARTSPF